MSQPISIIATLVGLDSLALARVWCDLNCWEWPRDIDAALKPVWWDGPSYAQGTILSDRKMGFNQPLMDYIEASIPKSIIMEEWRRLISRPREQDALKLTRRNEAAEGAPGDRLQLRQFSL